MEDDRPSALMAELYGDAAEAVYKRLAGLDPKVNEFIQRFVYDEIWRLQPLKMREKTLITVAALVAQSRPEQLRIHMTAFLACGGTIEELRAVIAHLAVYCGFPAALAALGEMNDAFGPNSGASKTTKGK